ncbi:urease accessory protein UreD [Devosia salina]|uniref:urease accessory protein UreD n=1 Tax=Devosia salina TaxID=2860336 RepID=UPI001F0AED9A|nr:urease accessory protein UreD [Devosia salina]
MKSAQKEIVIAPALQRARGVGRIATKQGNGRTRLDTLFQEGCGKIRLPNTHSPSLEAVLINTAGGITGGDHLSWSAEVAPDGHLVLTTQACERSYRSTGDFGRVETRLQLGAGAHLDWLPQETILFAASKLARKLDVDMAEGATLTAIESVLLGRDAMGEDAADALLRDNWRIRRNGRLIHAEATALRADPAERRSLSLLAGNRAFATVLHVAATPDQAEALCAQLRAMLPEGGAIGASATGERLVVRAMAPTGLALRRLIVPVLIELTGAGSLPRLWHL